MTPRGYICTLPESTRADSWGVTRADSGGYKKNKHPRWSGDVFFLTHNVKGMEGLLHIALYYKSGYF